MNIYVKGNKKVQLVWDITARVEGMPLSQFVAIAVEAYWKSELSITRKNFASAATEKLQNELISERKGDEGSKGN